MVGRLPRGRRAYRRAGCSGEGGTTWFVRIKTLFSFEREEWAPVALLLGFLPMRTAGLRLPFAGELVEKTS